MLGFARLLCSGFFFYIPDLYLVRIRVPDLVQYYNCDYNTCPICHGVVLMFPLVWALPISHGAELLGPLVGALLGVQPPLFPVAPPLLSLV